MKKYLDLIPISAKVHKKQSKMTRICIILSVFLVTAIFSMADMEIRSQYLQTVQSDGNWHAVFQEINLEQAETIKAHSEVTATSWYDVLNYRLDQAYEIEGYRVAICAFEEGFYELLPAAKVVEGRQAVSNVAEYGAEGKQTGSNVAEYGAEGKQAVSNIAKYEAEGKQAVSNVAEYGAESDAASTESNEANRELACEAVLTLNAKEKLGVSLGDSFVMNLPDGSQKEMTISGFTSNTGMIMADDAIGVFVDMRMLEQLGADTDWKDRAFYVQFSSKCYIPSEITGIEKELGIPAEKVGRNEKLLGVMGMSKDSYIMQLYGVAVVLAVLVVTAGVLMITSNLNSNIAKRTEFFGMLRCQGATKSQVKRFVRLEALNWCKSAIPIGVGGGIVITCILCNMLRLLSPSYFSEMPVLGISVLGIVSGIVIGIVTVLLAASAPAKRAAKVSPLTAVSGNFYQTEAVRKNAKVGLFHVETALGIHHARGSKKNFWLMAGSFAFSIILFLAFMTAVDFLGHALKPLKPYTPDLSVISQDNTCSVSPEKLEQIQLTNGVKRTYGRMFAYHLPVVVDGKELVINLISYEEHQFNWAEDALEDGALEDVINGGAVLTVYDMNNPLRCGDEMTIDFGEEANREILTTGMVEDEEANREILTTEVVEDEEAVNEKSKREEAVNEKSKREEAVNEEMKQASQPQTVKIAGVLSECPFSREEGIETVICSEETFRKLTGENGYTILDVQLNKKATDADVAAIREIAGTGITFSDQRMNNRDVKGGYYSMALFIYGFLAIIALISVFNIINSIAMSVSARLGQYGAMRAIGMSDNQVIRMVAAEALTYAVSGVALGCIIGLPMHKLIFEGMITFRWGDAWTLPLVALLLILLTVGASTIFAIIGPAKQIRRMTIVDTIRGE